MPKNLTVKKIVTSKNFNYSNNDTSLNFSLNVDTSEQPKRFKNLLLLALQDLEEIISKLERKSN